MNVPSKGRGVKAAVMSTAQRPQAPPVNDAGIPAELREVPQWVGWRYEPRPPAGGSRGWAKVPLRPQSGERASPTDRATWGDFSQAFDAYRRWQLDGVGFVFASACPFAGVDLDDGRDPATGELDGWAAEIVSHLASYAEVSPSGTGAKLILRGRLRGRRRRAGPVEVYDRGRFFTITGHRLPGVPPSVEPRQQALDELYNRLFPDASAATHACVLPATDDDAELIRRASSALDGALFQSLWEGDWEGRYLSQSEADLALCGRLAFWCGPDARRIDRLVRCSSLMRPKWDERRGSGTYGARTIAKALSSVGGTRAAPPRVFLRPGRATQTHTQLGGRVIPLPVLL
jgi:primase-polymerase (primpol)-like protein